MSELQVRQCKSCSAPILWAAIAWTPPGRPPKVCDTCVVPCERRRREECRARRAERQLAQGAARRPVRVRPPFSIYALPDGGHRCFTRGCHVALMGRAKKCQACKARERAEACAILAGLCAVGSAAA